jgi:hypothetical protein
MATMPLQPSASYGLTLRIELSSRPETLRRVTTAIEAVAAAIVSLPAGSTPVPNLTLRERCLAPWRSGTPPGRARPTWRCTFWMDRRHQCRQVRLELRARTCPLTWSTTRMAAASCWTSSPSTPHAPTNWQPSAPRLHGWLAGVIGWSGPRSFALRQRSATWNSCAVTPVAPFPRRSVWQSIWRSTQLAEPSGYVPSPTASRSPPASRSASVPARSSAWPGPARCSSTSGAHRSGLRPSSRAGRRETRGIRPARSFSSTRRSWPERGF